MGARCRIFLIAEEDRTLLELRAATTVPQRVKDRADVLRLNAQGWYVEKIAAYLHWHPQTEDTLSSASSSNPIWNLNIALHNLLFLCRAT